THVIAEATAFDRLPGCVGEFRDVSVRLATESNVRTGLSECRDRGCRRMWANDHLLGATGQSSDPALRDADLRWRTPPEEIGRRRGNDDEIGIETVDARAGRGDIDVLSLGIDELCFVAGSTHLLHGEHQFEWDVRIAAAKVGGPGEVPIRIDEGKSHDQLASNEFAA